MAKPSERTQNTISHKSTHELQMVRDWVSKKAKSATLTRLPGDASSRHYYRVRARGASYIVMKLAPFVDQGDQLPFVQVQRHLAKLGVNVPQVLDLNPKLGTILLSDLGDETMLKRLESASKTRDQLVWFKKAIDLLAHMQTAATQQTAPIDAYGLYFDEEKLMWEVNFTLAHFYNGVLAPKIPPKEQKTVQTYFQYICKKLASQEWHFTHRDYHTRNIMVVDKRLYMIDFQDARLGCPQYDLASLLRDSYYQLEEDVVYDLVEYYLRVYKKQFTGSEIVAKDFIKIFDLMSVQRNFKAIGSFASFYSKRQDVRYLKFIGNTFENIRRNLIKFPELHELRALLYRYYYF